MCNDTDEMTYKTTHAPAPNVIWVQCFRIFEIVIVLRRKWNHAIEEEEEEEDGVCILLAAFGDDENNLDDI